MDNDDNIDREGAEVVVQETTVVSQAIEVPAKETADSPMNGLLTNADIERSFANMEESGTFKRYLEDISFIDDNNSKNGRLSIGYRFRNIPYNANFPPIDNKNPYEKNKQSEQ